MFTIFHLLELTGAFAGLAVGLIFGHGWFGWLGVILGGAVGFFAGRILGRVPLAISSAMLKRDLKRCDVATLRSRLDQEYYISHLIIAELVVRGEPIESFRDYVSELLRSDSPDRRRFGELNLQMWPETAQPSPISPSSAPKSS
jgi:hypothetical protein